MRRRLQATGVLVVGMAVAGGCGGGSSALPSDPIGEVFQQQAREEQLTRVETDGKRLFAVYCATCHGETGAGDGQNAFNLDPAPPAFEASLKSNPPTYWRQIIEGGTGAVGRSPLCPPWGRTLQDADVDALIAYLRVLSAGGPSQADQSTSPTGGGSVEPGGS